MKGIDVKLLRAFVTLAEKGSYVSAAKTLFLTQPALSRQIQTLERLTGGQLFLRGRHGATLTTFGSQLFPKANEILQSHADFLTYAKELKHGRHDRLFLGFGVSSFHHVPRWINQFHQQFPECEVVINQMPSSVQIKMLQEGGLHMGFIRMPATNALSSQVIFSEVLALAVPSVNHVESTNLQNALSTYPLFQLDSLANPCLAEQTALFLKNNQLHANLVSVTGDMMTLLALVAGGNGVAFLPESAKYFLPTGVKMILPTQNPVRWDIAVVWNPEIISHWRDDFLKMAIVCDNYLTDNSAEQVV
ncbi:MULTISPECIES: LysR family transcriptional regulator [Enterobacteriaceae]|uniref:LysR family transcriptional regulator n=1 Tax=Raoultella lignicola TaxID=3040939 RepID=A0ABU9FBF7_9ENTR|nr:MULTISPECIES: LysR family transcriptional regulator [Enterobacteriaceae]MRT50553.1 LysR family transcriptional regulator [Raoultella sp. RIT712]QNK08352.1 LysR family transcriptional regulator [Enterobacter sp. JUb54]ROS16445.1 DNA-binding transcriptional LysR family regulator [Raoultella sp. BIGb0399]